MNTQKRLQDLLKGADFWDFDFHCEPARVVAVARHNNEEIAKLKALGENRIERAWDILALAIAEAIQSDAFKAYGEISCSSIRRLLIEDAIDELSIRDWATFVIQALPNEELTEEQVTQIAKLMEQIPTLILDGIVVLVGKFNLMTPDEVPQIAMTLGQMFKEISYVDAG